MYEIDQDTIRFSTGRRHKFQATIAETLEFDEAIVVRLNSGSMPVAENIFGFDYNGKLLWQLPPARTFEVRSSYVSLLRRGGYLEVLNWDGHLLTVHPKDGTILSEEFYSGGRSSRHRVASRRNWL